PEGTKTCVPPLRRVTVAVVPSRPEDSSVSSWPRRRQISAARCSPMPVEAPYRRPLAPVKYLSKTRGRSSGGMPGPSSRTTTLAPAPQRSTLTSTCPPGGEYLTALVNSCLSTTCSHFGSVTAATPCSPVTLG